MRWRWLSRLTGNPHQDVAEIRLHLDADASLRALHRELRRRGHDVTRTPCDWMPEDASDEEQLLGSTAQGRAVFTFNVRDFTVLAQMHPYHHGIILAAQRSWTLTTIIVALDRFLLQGTAEEVAGRVHWLPRPDAPASP